jgi:high-affinity iron transporter
MEEAGLIVGIVLAATEGVAGRGRWIAGGVATGVAGACLVAAFAAALSDAFEAQGRRSSPLPSSVLPWSC